MPATPATASRRCRDAPVIPVAMRSRCARFTMLLRNIAFHTSYLSINTHLELSTTPSCPIARTNPHAPSTSTGPSRIPCPGCPTSMTGAPSSLCPRPPSRPASGSSSAPVCACRSPPRSTSLCPPLGLWRDIRVGQDRTSTRRRPPAGSRSGRRRSRRASCARTRATSGRAGCRMCSASSTRCIRLLSRLGAWAVVRRVVRSLVMHRRRVVGNVRAALRVCLGPRLPSRADHAVLMRLTQCSRSPTRSPKAAASSLCKSVRARPCSLCSADSAQTTSTRSRPSSVPSTLPSSRQPTSPTASPCLC